MMKFNKWKSKVDSGAGNATDTYGDHRGFRTHLIFAGKRDPEGAPSVLGAPAPGSNLLRFPSATRSPSHSNHPFAQAQTQNLAESGKGGGGDSNLLVRDDAFRNKAVLPPSSKGGGKTPHRGVALQDQGYSGGGTPSNPTSLQDHAPAPPPGLNIVLDGLSRDSFIIPIECVDRFLPAGVTLPQLQSRSKPPSKSGSNSLNVMEVEDPQLATVVHLMTPLIPLKPPLDPLSNPEHVQTSLAIQLGEKARLAGQACHGLLLASLEVSSDFPCIALFVVPKLRTDVADFLNTARKDALASFDPSVTNHCGDNFFYLCREVAAIQRPGGTEACGTNKSKTTGYIVSVFRVFDGDDREKLERNWLYWTGARTLYRHLPKGVGLRRITLHKSAALRGDKLYLLLCECANVLQNINAAAQLLPALRARLCGYSGIYKIAHSF